MKITAAQGLARILKTEGIPWVSVYPTCNVNNTLAEEGIPLVMMREERYAAAVADAFSRVTNGRQIGVCTVMGSLNPAGLQSIGGNLFKTTPASGEEIAGMPGIDGMAKTHQGFLEMSNVKIVEEMVNMIVAQRAYEVNSKAIQTSDSMLGTAIGLKR